MWPFSHRSNPDDSPSAFEKEIMGSLDTLSDQIAKFVRWSYRSQKNEAEILTTVQTRLDEISQDRQSEVRQLSNAVGNLSQIMIAWADDLDVIFREPGVASSTWSPVLARWSRQLQDGLEGIGFQELPVLGQPFDPQIAEALGSTGQRTGPHPPRPYQVVEVLRRGYLLNAQLYRKAQVIIYKEAEVDNG